MSGPDETPEGKAHAEAALRKFAPHAYLDKDFLDSDAARIIRILSEFVEPQDRFERAGVAHTIVVFGSARIRSPEVAERELREVEAEVRGASPVSDDLVQRAQAARERQEMAQYYQAAEELSYRLTKWSQETLPPERQFTISTGGGPGIMEAANRGADRAGGRSIGLNIDLAHEQEPNAYITGELMFQFRYFMMRKFWFSYLARCMVAFPGGFGTFDEVFEILTLMQAERLVAPKPVVLFGTDFWKRVVDFDALVRFGTIGKNDLEHIQFLDTVDDAFAYVTKSLEDVYLKGPPEKEPDNLI
jgi:uncharacterized protein (TIGR00730 family)